LEHVLGWAAFAGLRLRVAPGVFVPRRRTELLVREAALRARPGTLAVDLCCGCGAVAAALAAVVPGVDVHAVDRDPDAVACARRNLPHADRVWCGDLFEPLPQRLRGHVDLVVASPPYVPTAALPLMPREARDHEPALALDGGADGLAVHRRVLARAAAWLAPGGHVLLECAEDQAPSLCELFTVHGFSSSPVSDGDSGGALVLGRPTAARSAFL